MKARVHALSGSLHDVVRLPFDGDKPAAFIFECVQGEGGVNVLERLVRDAAAHRPRPSESTTTTPAAS
jgi:acetylornithine/succinyldiaminopimelate/putrescine aminotransferase